jgi:hypothetical protein
MRYVRRMPPELRTQDAQERGKPHLGRFWAGAETSSLISDWLAVEAVAGELVSGENSR